MYQNIALLAALVFTYGVIAGGVARSWLSGPILFAAAGFALGPLGLDALRLAITANELKLLAEASLAMALFTDAASTNLGVVRRNLALPGRLLLIGLPLTIILGFLFAAALFPAAGLLTAAMLAAVLAPTDAALGAPVLADETAPIEAREALNIESGLNDGICVPLIVILLDIAVGIEMRHNPLGRVIEVILEEIGFGVLLGAAASAVAILGLRVAARRDWLTPHWAHVPVVALAALCFAGAQMVGGSGFIACFVGGLVFGSLYENPKDMVAGAGSVGEVLAMLTWIVFGGPVAGRLLAHMSWRIALYALFSLTLVRIAPVFVSLIGVRMPVRDKLFIGWFGPRGLASIVFAIIIFDADAPGKDVIAVATALTVILSVIAHGVTASPLARTLMRNIPTLTR